MSAELIESSQLAKYLALKQSLSTHHELKDRPDLVEEACRVIMESKLQESHVTFFATISNRNMEVSKFCLIANHMIDDMILDQSWEELVSFIGRGKDMCVEIYRNPLLKGKDDLRRSLAYKLYLEYVAVTNAIKNYDPEGQEEIVPVCCDEHGECLASLCYQELAKVSRIEGEILYTDREVQFLEYREGEITPILNRYDIVDLMGDMSRKILGQPCLNRYTQQKFSSQTLKQLEAKYQWQLLMTKRYYMWLLRPSR